MAEGVETREQADFLKSINCDVAQGYYYSKPLDVESFKEYFISTNGVEDIGKRA